MSRTREAFVLPLLFLTVALLGGVRVADRIVLLPPPLFTLVLAFLLVGVLVRSGALAPERLMSATRSPLANVSGAVVIVTAFGRPRRHSTSRSPSPACRGCCSACFCSCCWSTRSPRRRIACACCAACW